MISPVCLHHIRHHPIPNSPSYDPIPIDHLDLFKLINFNPLPTFIIDKNLSIKLANHLSLSLFGNIQGRPIHDLCTPIPIDASILSLCDCARLDLAIRNQLLPSHNPSLIPSPPPDLLSRPIPSLDVLLHPSLPCLASNPFLHQSFLLQLHAFEPAPASPDELWFHCSLRIHDPPRNLSCRDKFINRIQHAINDCPVDWPLHAVSADRTVSIANKAGCLLFQALKPNEIYPNSSDHPSLHDLGDNRGENGFSTHKWSLFDPDFNIELPRDDYPLERAIRGLPVTRNQYGCVLPDGSRRIMSIGAKTISDSDSTGQILGGLVYVNDVTDELEKIKQTELEKARLKAEALAADDANKSKSAFLSNMSHEIRTPIAVIMGLIDLLLDSNLTPQQHDYAETIKASADCLLSVIGDVLDLSKIESGKLTFEARPFDLCQLVSEVERLFSHAAKGKANTLKCILLPAPGQMTRIIGDRGRIRQVLNNLISNSLKFTHRGSVTVTVRLEPRPCAEPGELCLTADIVDTGIGLTPQALQRLAQFQPFSQADSSTSRLYGGTGLGLCIVKSLVDGMGGQVCLRSDGLGKGCHATAVMMVKSANDRPRPIHTPLTRQPSSTVPILANDRSSYSILVADDNPIMAKITVTLLERRGFKTDLVVNGQQALERALEKYAASGNQASYDLVIVDLMMPVLDGFQAVRAMRQAMPNVYLPVIALSASAVRGNREKCIESKFDEYLNKPIKCEDLEERVIHFLSLVDRNRKSQYQQHQSTSITTTTTTTPIVAKSSPATMISSIPTANTTTSTTESTRTTAVVVVELDEKMGGVIGAAKVPSKGENPICGPHRALLPKPSVTTTTVPVKGETICGPPPAPPPPPVLPLPSPSSTTSTAATTTKTITNRNLQKT